MTELASRDLWDQALVAVLVACQALALAGLCWVGVRADRHLRDGQARVSATSRETALALQAVQQAQAELARAARTATEAVTTLSVTAQAHDPAALQTLLDLVRELHARPSAAAGAAADAPSAPQAEAARAAAADADLQLHRRIGQLQGEVSELRRRLEDRDRQVETLNRDRRRFAEEAAALAGVKATHERLMAELKDKRQESRRLQASIDPMTLEVKSLRAQIGVMQRQLVGGADPARLDAALVEQTRGVFEERLQELERLNQGLDDQLRTTRQELLRTQREKAFIEDHYLDLART